jgi:energy-coupling factor transporter ATP-binding protein EcfA2
MELIVRNCNSIDEAKITVEENRLNIKYAMNGTGKSTIAKAIDLYVEGGEAITALMPFKYIGKEADEALQPSVEGADGITSISIFDDNYINQFVFQQDELLNNSFEIFIKNAEYDRQIGEIESIIADIKDTFNKNQELEQVIKDLATLSNGFGKSKAGYSKAGAIGKGIGNGNKIENIPNGLEGYSDYLKSDANVKWLKWQMNGQEFLEISESCPYCTSPTEEKKESILLVSKEFDSKSIEHLNNVLAILEALGKYFSDDTNEKLHAITKNKSALSEEEINFLKEIKVQADILKEKLSDLRSMTFFSLKDVDNVSNEISKLKINIDFLSHLNSEETKRVSGLVNESLNTVVAKAGKLQGEVNKHKQRIQKTIEKHKIDINKFLKFAGYNYLVDIQVDGDSYKMKLRHKDFSENIASGAQHLSYGEKNAFALVLFMYECITKNPSLIILDDPISSFDRNKKFAIIDALFRRAGSLKDKTVLMMTHDLEPIIDMVYNLPSHFDPVPKASFLESSNGVVVEKDIQKKDILTFSQVCMGNIRVSNVNVIKLIYLRRYYEIVDNKGCEYQLISSLLHKRATPIYKSDEGVRDFTTTEFDRACSEINNEVSGFNYEIELRHLQDDEYMRSKYQESENNYEKLQLFRIMNDGGHENNIITKYINEAFHIENEYIMQLNPCEYETTPGFIIEECDRELLNLS